MPLGASESKTGELEGKRILQASSYEELWKRAAPMGSLASYGVKGKGYVGLSWFSFTYGGHRVVMHAGSDQGFQSFVGLLPDESARVVVMGNIKASIFHVATMGLALLRALLEQAK